MRKTQARGVVLAASSSGAIAAKLHGLLINVVSGGADDTFRATANMTRDVVVIVIDADQLDRACLEKLGLAALREPSGAQRFATLTRRLRRVFVAGPTRELDDLVVV